jgi:hypothetical protein
MRNVPMITIQFDLIADSVLVPVWRDIGGWEQQVNM